MTVRQPRYSKEEFDVAIASTKHKCDREAGNNGKYVYCYYRINENYLRSPFTKIYMGPNAR